jgi:hypothetical protein
MTVLTLLIGLIILQNNIKYTILNNVCQLKKHTSDKEGCH